MFSSNYNRSSSASPPLSASTSALRFVSSLFSTCFTLGVSEGMCFYFIFSSYYPFPLDSLVSYLGFIPLSESNDLLCYVSVFP